MSVVIIGGNERMIFEYKQICKKYNYKAKIFIKMVANLKSQIGKPDLIILFTSTVSHKMVNCAVTEATKNKILMERSHTSSANALINILESIS